MLTTLIAARARLNLPDTADDLWLSMAINWATGLFEQRCNRDFGRAEGVLQNFDACDCTILLRRYPVETVSLFALQSRNNVWTPQTSVDYTIDKESGVLRLTYPIGSANELARVAYTGGYVLPGTDPEDGQATLPPELEAACLDQVAYWYQRRDQLGLTSVSAGGGSVSLFAGQRLLPIVEETIEPHRRLRLI